MMYLLCVFANKIYLEALCRSPKSGSIAETTTPCKIPLKCYTPETSRRPAAAGSDRRCTAAIRPPRYPRSSSGMLPTHICSILATSRAFLQHQDALTGSPFVAIPIVMAGGHIHPITIYSRYASRLAKQIRNWLDECKDKHLDGCTNPGSSILPKRLILLDNPRNGERLVE